MLDLQRDKKNKKRDLTLIRHLFLWLVIGLFFSGKRGFAFQDTKIESLTRISQYSMSQWIAFSDLISLTSKLKSGSQSRDFFSEEYLPFRWGIGFGYGLIQAPGNSVEPYLSKGVFSAKGRFGFNLLSSWKLDFDFSYNQIASESYVHGSADIRIEYVWSFGDLSLKKKNEFESNADADKKDEQDSILDPSQDLSDASFYYEQERKRKFKKLEKDWELEREGLSEEEIQSEMDLASYPRVFIGYHLGFNLHAIAPQTLQLSSNQVFVPQNIQMYQYQYGPHISYAPSYGIRYEIALHYFLYSTSVGSFVQQLNLEDSARVPALASVDLSAFSNQLLAFPLWMVYALGSWIFENQTRLEWKASYVRYSLSQQQSTVALSPSYFYEPAHSAWSFGGGIGAVMQGVCFSLKGLSLYGSVLYRY